MTFFPKKCKKVGKLQLFKNRNKNRKHECWKVKRDVQSGQMCTGRSPWVLLVSNIKWCTFSQIYGNKF